MGEDASRTIDSEEVARFDRLASLWWDLEGPFRPLHRMNGLRIRWILAAIGRHFDLQRQESTLGLKGLKVLDVGCGGGILSEGMARLGANMTGIDVVEKNIKIARHHAEREGLAIDYRAIGVEELSQNGAAFDVVLNMEVVEHVGDLPLFLNRTASLVRPGGLMIVATLNRTLLSHLVAIILAEHVFGWLPKGTHQWEKFVRPEELVTMLRPEALKPVSSTGVWMNPLTHNFHEVGSMSINYMTCFIKAKDPV